MGTIWEVKMVAIGKHPKPESNVNCPKKYTMFSETTELVVEVFVIIILI